MSRLPPNQLTALQVSRHKAGSLGDGGGLWLVASGNSRLWEFRYTSPVTGKRRSMGLGSMQNCTLSDARKKAAQCRLLVSEGRDPIEERDKEKAAARLEAGQSFSEVAALFIEEQSPAWKDRKAVKTWTGSLSLHIFPVFGSKAVRLIDTHDILAALRPVWTEKTETAERLRSRIERILDYAKAQGWREGENPARWRGHLSAMLPAPSKLKKQEHHKAAAWADIKPIMEALTRSEGIAAKAVRFICLTATRSGETRGCLWSEIDLKERLWTIPAERMKAAREHRIPLSDAAMSVLSELEILRCPDRDSFVFPGGNRGRPLSDVSVSKALHLAAGTKSVTVHGLRSTFRDWTADTEAASHDVAEMALAHTISNKTEAAYRRTDLLEQRRALMQLWSEHCLSGHQEAETGTQ
ncbi:tyrosine-type recombinase/integrase [Acetobacter thailandicus]|uniref:tyrosine-type recombinase/integrase n=1 Tax=Acetobacter thailandicus TaxID=1502842 RepID=UPI001BA4D2A6|nr:integrase arm-type DNA-binding domain-containing protein [Acetobacter thailandicus]MBS0986631.1 tyrosine-type recombinase/integrase [Acetobacter thailandicus]